MNKTPKFNSIEQLWKSIVKPADYQAVDHLWKMLPGVYRERDEPDQDREGKKGDLKLYLEGFGIVLDQVKKNLDQRLRDTSPLTCQSWLLPYFADMLDVRLVSPDIEGQRQEIANAVSWRQRKGTVAVCVEIAEAVGQMPIIAYEGHNSVATNPRVGYRQPTMIELGEPNWQEPPKDQPKDPSRSAERPGTPAVTVDFRKLSAPFEVDEQRPTPLSVKSRFGDEEILWQHENAPHGVPEQEYPGYRDVSMRTPDMRTPNWREGLYHPKRFRLYTPVAEGFLKEYGIGKTAVNRLLTPMPPPDPDDWKESTTKANYLYHSKIDEIKIRRSSTLTYIFIEERLLPESIDSMDNASLERIIRRTLITKNVPVSSEELQRPNDWADEWQQNDFLLQWERHFVPDSDDYAKGIWYTSVKGGTWNLIAGEPGSAGKSLTERQHLKKETRWPTLIDNLDIIRPETDVLHPHYIEVKQLTLMNRLILSGEQCILTIVAVKSLEAKMDRAQPPASEESQVVPAHVKATHCLIQNITPGNLIFELEYCTVNTDWTCSELRASDCILLGELTVKGVELLRLRYCCAPELASSAWPENWVIHKDSVTSEQPIFYDSENYHGRHSLFSKFFGERGFAVLHQNCPASIRHGAEDGGELGAFHDRHYCGRQDAVLEKLVDFLPVGMLPVLIIDRYWQAPLTR
ncbi:MAG: hypothetical protein LWX54_10025 [Deltaproteobacteria bacterium]|jgi:hypothetical protein|nr:hypothetical protein [Deltaproteobacteria bacterium]